MPTSHAAMFSSLPSPPFPISLSQIQLEYAVEEAGEGKKGLEKTMEGGI